MTALVEAAQDASRTQVSYSKDKFSDQRQAAKRHEVARRQRRMVSTHSLSTSMTQAKREYFSRRKEVHTLLSPVDVPDVDLTEVIL